MIPMYSSTRDNSALWNYERHIPQSTETELLCMKCRSLQHRTRSRHTSWSGIGSVGCSEGSGKSNVTASKCDAQRHRVTRVGNFYSNKTLKSAVYRLIFMSGLSGMVVGSSQCPGSKSRGWLKGALFTSIEEYCLAIWNSGLQRISDRSTTIAIDVMRPAAVSRFCLSRRRLRVVCSSNHAWVAACSSPLLAICDSPTGLLPDSSVCSSYASCY